MATTFQQRNFSSSKKNTSNIQNTTNGFSQNKSKNRHIQAISSLKKKEQWDDRFVLEKIPQYKYQQKNLYEKNSLSNQGQQNVFQPGRIRKNMNTQNIDRPTTNQNARGNSKQDGIVNKYFNMQEQKRPVSGFLGMTQQQLEEKIIQLGQQINQLWNQYNIPNFHKKLFTKANKELPKRLLVQSLQKEINSFQMNKSIIQNCLRAIKARETCLQALIEKSQSLENLQDEELKQGIEKCSELVIHQRILSLNVVESILRWRQSITITIHQANEYKLKQNPNFVQQQDESPPMPFIYKQENYLIKMNQDTKELIDSPLSQYMQLAAKPDPFFISSQKAKMNTGNVITILHEIKPSVIHRIRASELIIFEECIQKKLFEKNLSICVEPLNCYEDEIENIFSKYIKQVEQSYNSIFQSFVSDTQQLLKEVQTQHDVSWLKFVNEETRDISGMAVIHSDKTQFGIRRIRIQHLSTLQQDSVQKCIDALIKYILEKDTCDEIRVHLKFLNNNEGKYQVEKNIEGIFKKHGFKWKQLIRDQDQHKVEILGLKSQEEISQEIKNLRSNEQIQLEQAVILSNEQQFSDLPKISLNQYDISPSIVGTLVQLLSAEDIQQIEEKNQNNQFIKWLLQLMKIFQDKKLKIPGFLTQQNKDIEQQKEHLQKLFTNKEDLSNYNVKQFQNQSISSIMNLAFRWDSFQTVIQNEEDKQIKYLRLNKTDEESFSVKICQQLQNPVCTVKTDQDTTNIIVFNLEDSEIEELNKTSLQQYVTTILKDQDQENQVKDDIQNIWLPAFEKNIDFHQIPQLSENQVLNTCVSKIKFSLNYKNQINAGLKIRGIDEKSIKIRAPFIFCIIEDKITSEIEYPLFVTLVNRENY